MRVLQRAQRKALVLSPAASHPQDFGNRRRVYQTCDFLRRQGYEIHFLLYPMEPDWMSRVQVAARDMRREWDSFQIIPSSRPLPLQSPALGDHHKIDEWWDPTIGVHLRWLFEREHFDVFVVNYIFLSKALEFAGARTVKVLETHDRFSGRKELLMALGARIESFYTTEVEEKVALDRCDIVVAIKESEAAFYRGLTNRQVVTVPFWLEQKKAEPKLSRLGRDGPLLAGFIGALNVVNVANITAFLQEFETDTDISGAEIEFVIAGDVCHHLQSLHPQVRLLGRVESLEEFYGSLDVVAVPMASSTGLKIKTGEALAFGKAVVAMADGFDGFPPVDEFHCLESFREVCRALTALAANRSRVRQLEIRSRVSAALARRRMEAGYRRLAAAISRFLPAILFLTDQALFEEGNVSVERLAQWCQLCSGIATTLVGYLGEHTPTHSRPELEQIEVISIGSPTEHTDLLSSAIEKIGRRHSIAETIVSAEGPAGLVLLGAAKNHCKDVTMDTWWVPLANAGSGYTLETAPDVWPPFGGNSGAPQRLSSPFRYAPRWLDHWKTMRADGTLIVLCGPDDDDLSGLEHLYSAFPNVSRDCVLSLARSPGAPFQRDFLSNLRDCERPALFLAIGADARARAICTGLATAFGSVCFHIASVAFPILVPRQDGTPCICDSYADFAENVGNLATLAEIAVTQMADTGWSAYKQRLVQRLSARMHPM